MSLPPMKSMESSQIPDEPQDANATAGSVNNSNSNNSSASAQATQQQDQQKPGSQSAAQINAQAEDAYRYAPHQQQQQPPQQQQQQIPGQQQQHPYYAYQPVYSQQQQQQFQGQTQQAYPGYYQSSMSSTSGASGAATAGGVGQQAASGAYPDYSAYSRVGYVQNYNPVYSQGVVGMPGGSVSSGSGVAQQTPSHISSVSASGIGQVQPVGSRPRVTTTMWEDEKTLCYQVDANNVSVVRRADNNMINGTKLLNVAHMTRGRRDGILKSEKVRDVVKIGSMHLKGVWIPFERALAMAQREGIVDLLYPLFVRDIKQVIQQGSTTQPQANPQQWGFQQAAQVTAPGPGLGQTNVSALGMQHSSQDASGQAPGAAPQIKQSNSPYMTPNSLASSGQIEGKSAPQSSSGVPQTSQPLHQQQQAPQPMQQSYYGYPYYPQYQYGYAGYGNSTGAAVSQGVPQSGAATSAGLGSVASGTAAASYQYPQYGYGGYMPQYQAPQYEEQKDK